MLFAKTINDLAKMMVESSADSPLCQGGCFSQLEDSRDDSKSVETENIDDAFKERFTIAFDKFLDEQPNMIPGTNEVRNFLVNELVSVQYLRAQEEKKMKTKLELLKESKKEMERELQFKIIQVAKEKTESKIKLKNQLQALWKNKAKSERAMKHSFLIALKKENEIEDRDGLEECDNEEPELKKGKINSEYVLKLENEVDGFRAENAILTLEVSKLRRNINTLSRGEIPKISPSEEQKMSQMMQTVQKVDKDTIPSHIYCTEEQKLVEQDDDKKAMNDCKSGTGDILRQYEQDDSNNQDNEENEENDEPRDLVDNILAARSQDTINDEPNNLLVDNMNVGTKNPDDNFMEIATDDILVQHSRDELDIDEPEGATSDRLGSNLKIESLFSASVSTDRADENRHSDEQSENGTRLPSSRQTVSCSDSIVYVKEGHKQTDLHLNEKLEDVITASNGHESIVGIKCLPSQNIKNKKITSDNECMPNVIGSSLSDNDNSMEFSNGVLKSKEENENDINLDFDDIFEYYNDMLNKE